MEQKQVLLDFQVKMSESIESMAELEQEISKVSEKLSEYQKKQKEGNSLSADERAEVIRLKEERKALQKEYGEHSRKVQNAIISEGKYKDTLKGLCAELSIAKDRLRAMKDAGSPEWQKQAEEVNALNEKIKAMEQSYGVFSRNVGNYESVLKSQSEIIAESARKVAELSKAGETASEEYQEAQQVLKDYGNSMQEAGRNGIEAMNSSLSGLVGAMTLVSTMMGEDSEEAKKMQEIMQKVSLAVAAVSIATQLYDAAQKKGLLTKIAYNLQVKAATKALKQEAVAEAGSTSAKVAGKVAQDALNTSMLANPVLLVVAAVAALVTGLVALVSWLMKSTDAQKAANQAQKEYDECIRVTENSLIALQAKENARLVNTKKRYEDEIALMMKSGATQEQIDKKKKDLELALLDVQTESGEERIKLQDKEAKKAYENYTMQNRLLAELVKKKGKDAKATKEQQTKVDEAYRSYVQYNEAITSSIEAMNDAEFTRAQSAYEQSKAIADKVYNNAQTRLSDLDKLVQESLKRRYAFVYDYNKSAQENDAERFRNSIMLEQQVFLKQQEIAKKKLELDKKYGKITLKEYKSQLAIMESELKTFLLNQSENIAEHTRAILNEAIQLAGGKNLDGQLKDVASKYDAAEKSIRESLELSEEEKSFYLVNLAKKRESEIKAVRESINDETIKNITDRIQEAHKEDKRQFSADEEEYLSMEIEKQKKLIEEKKKAGLSTLADEAVLAQLEFQLREAAMNGELAVAWKNADERYRIRKEFIEKELEMEGLSVQQRADYERELADIESGYRQEKLDKFSEYANFAMDALSQMDSLISSLGEKQVAQAERENVDKKASLDKRLKAGLISQKDYDKQVEKLDSDLDKKKADLERKAAIRQKAMSAMQIAINTATAIMKIWAEVPKVDFGATTVALTAAASAMGAIQLATVLAQPLPQARRGGRVQGPSHEGGGVLINTEGDERIISANPSRAFPELLNLISYIGKHYSIPDTGFGSVVLSGSANQVSKEMDYERLSDLLASKMSSLLQNIKIYTAITDIRDADKEYTKVENSAKI